MEFDATGEARVMAMSPPAGKAAQSYGWRVFAAPWQDITSSTTQCTGARHFVLRTMYTGALSAPGTAGALSAPGTALPSVYGHTGTQR